MSSIHDLSSLNKSQENLDKIARGSTLNINTAILVDHNPCTRLVM